MMANKLDTLGEKLAENDFSLKDTSTENIDSIKKLFSQYHISVIYKNNKIMILDNNNEILYSKSLPIDGEISKQKERALLLFVASLLGKHAARNSRK